MNTQALLDDIAEAEAKGIPHRFVAGSWQTGNCFCFWGWVWGSLNLFNTSRHPGDSFLSSLLKERYGIGLGVSSRWYFDFVTHFDKIIHLHNGEPQAVIASAKEWIRNGGFVARGIQ